MTRLLATIFAFVVLAAVALAAEDFAAKRRLMVEEIERLAAGTERATLDPRVLEAMAKLPRHGFVPQEEASAAYENRPLAIGHGQTISQPFIVAFMTDLLQPKPLNTVLEVGTGSGYQAAVLSLLARSVYTIEIIEDLGNEAANRLTRLGHINVKSKIGDGYLGWAEHAPFDAIIVTAAPDHIPPALLEQLKPNGRMVIPVGELIQDLMLVVKNPDGTNTSTTIVPVRFVPLIRRGKTD